MGQLDGLFQRLIQQRNPVVFSITEAMLRSISTALLSLGSSICTT
ncbi:MAG: hypothetical protein R3E89_17080 [Thiolinea sp.]